MVVNNDIDMATEWNDWIDEYNNYFIAAKINAETAEIQVANMRTALGRDAIKILRNLGLSEAEMKNLATIKTKLTEHFSPARNKTYERCQFHRLKQQPNESFEDFLQKLREQVKRCGYGTNADEFTMDQIVLGINSDDTRQKLWVEEELTLDKAKKICRAAERAGKQISELNNEHSPVSVNQIKGDESRTFKCKRCGLVHGYRNCPAYGKECRSCGSMHHFEAMCKSKDGRKRDKKERSREKKFESKNVRAISSDSDSYSEYDDDDFRFVSAIEMQQYSETKEVNALNSKENEKWCGTVRVNDKSLKLKLDTGANCNVLSENEVNRLSAHIGSSTTKRLITYSGESINVIGEVSLLCETKKKKENVSFRVVKENLQPILGRKMCEKLGFIIRVNEVDHSDSLGCCKNFEYDIDFIENPNFKIIPARRIPHALIKKVKKELDKMVKLEVIEPISEPTPAVSPMLVVEQKDKIRVCMDPTDLNKNIKRRHYPLKTVEQIAATIAGSKFFTKLDCQKGFWQLKVSKRTSKYLTFSTP